MCFPMNIAKFLRTPILKNISEWLLLLRELKENTGLKWVKVNPLTTNVPHHIETSQLILIANQLTGFYMMGNIGP